MIFNLEVEKAMIGCLLLGKKEYALKLNETDFTQESLRQILKAVQELDKKNKPVDIIAVADMLPHVTGIYEILASLTDVVATTENAEYYFQTVKEYAAKRAFERAANEIISKTRNSVGKTAAELKADILQLVDIPVFEQKKSSFEFKHILNDTLTSIDEEYRNKQDNRYMTGFHDLDKLTAGLHPEEMTIIAARPGVGKTTMAINMIVNLAHKGIKCLLVSREMSGRQLMKRFIANYTPIDGHKLRLAKYLADEDFAKIGNATYEMMEWPVYINDEIATIQEIRAYARELKAKDEFEVLFVDYLQLCRSSNRHETRRLEIEEISRGFKEISMELGIPVVVLSQLSRDNARTHREPELHDLRESGSLEQDADNVIFLHIPKDTDTTQDIYDIQVILAKQRNGPTGYVYLRYYKKTFRLCNIAYQ